MRRCAGGGIIRSSAATKYQLGLVFQAGSVIVPLSASTPQGTWESAMNSAFAGSTSAAKAAGNLALSRNRYPSWGGRIGGTGAPGGEVLDLLENETGMHSCLASKPKIAGWRRRQEEASPWRREYRPRSGQARSSTSC